MVRAPCCEKMGLKKGPWTAEEDQILIAYILRNGHGNWRALPKQAGLLRCGKSCRLRWMNYLRPDIKRGNFSIEEEETIIKLHQTLGNRWSAIAVRLPGRTDNEIKNIWHTLLKKRLKQHPDTSKTEGCFTETSMSLTKTERELKPMNNIWAMEKFESPGYDSVDLSSPSTTTSFAVSSENPNMESNENFLFEVGSQETFPANSPDPWLQMPLSPVYVGDHVYPHNPYNDDSGDFWLNALMEAGELPYI